ncbi:DUF3352 domain-containing protein [Nocardioides sp. SOB44]|uniref:DUF3352 domain-containing protein n=1 Tax=Nocardioides cremeus TaxID=3058044 RepID=A0ABT8TXA4_9ACTN|nr:DUF3352 domain-containing protein [Nocardioides cremeus]MDO3397738.1 DUF3352 domain-containing protein [Nocardioides cremeus]
MDETPQQPRRPHDQDEPQAEVLEQGRGGPIAPRPRTSRRPAALVAGLGVLGLGLVGGAAFGAYWYLSDGAQAAEAFPADSVGYVGVTLDPSGKQKLAALETLQEFPTIADELDLEGSLEDVDVKRSIVEAVLEEAPCDLGYDDAVAPWLGERFGAAAVPAGEALPSMVFAVEVTDPDAADAGVRALLSCDGSDAESMAGWSVEGDWLLVAETPEIVAEVADAAAEGSLADDEDFRRWTGEAGDEGVLTAYAAPEAPRVLADLGSEFFGGELPGAEELEELDETLDDFEGMAAVLRFGDGALEIEAAGAASDQADALEAGAGELVTGLPDDTVLALAAGLGEGWSQALDEEGASLPVDVEALLGDVAALAIGPDLDPDALLGAFFSGDLSDVPVAAITRGDLDEAEEAIAQAGPLAASLEAREAGDRILVGPSGPWLDAVEAGGSLGDSDLFTSVVPDADGAGMVAFLDLGVVADLVDQAAPGVEEDRDLAQLGAVGASARVDGDVVRAVLRLTTR